MKIKKANTFIFWLLRILIPFLWIWYRFRFNMKTSKGIKRPCLILSNHQTSFDQFAVCAGFKFGINIVASDSLFRHGFLSWLMKTIARPIPISKGSSDSTAVRNIISVIKTGGSVLLFPTGNRTFFGEDGAMNPTIAKLAKKLKVPVVIVNLKGGYHTKPRWKKGKPNKGKMTGAVTKIFSPEELTALTDAEAYDRIGQALHVNDFENNAAEKIIYRGKRKAECLESALFYCPSCHSMHDLKSEKNSFFCTACGAKVILNGTGFFEKAENAEQLPDTILQWSGLQLEYIKNFDFSPFTDKPVFLDENIRFSKVERAKKQELIATGSITLYADRLTVCGTDIPVSEIKDLSIGVKKLNIYTGTETYAVDAAAEVNLLKYMVCGYRLKNAATGEEFYGY